MAGFEAENILQDRFNIFYWNEIGKIQQHELLIGVRKSADFEVGKIAEAINISVGEIRKKPLKRNSIKQQHLHLLRSWFNRLRRPKNFKIK